MKWNPAPFDALVHLLDGEVDMRMSMGRRPKILIICLVVSLTALVFRIYSYAQESLFKSVYASAKLGEISDSAIKENILYLAGKNGMAVLNITDPSRPRVIKTLISRQPFNDVFIEGNFAYVTAGKRWYPGGKLKIFDISSPEAIREIPNTLVLPESPISVTVKNNIAYLADYASGMILVDVKDPFNPKVMSNFDMRKEIDRKKYQEMLNFAKNNPVEFKKLLLVRFKALGLTPRRIDTWINDTGLEYIVYNLAYLKQYGHQGHVWWVALRYPYALVPYDGDGLYIVDISNPYKPVQVGFYIKKGPGEETIFFNSAAVSGDYAFVAVDHRGIIVLDISDVRNPREITHLNPWADYSWYEAPGHAVMAEIVGNLLYVTTGEDGIYIYDISTPGVPRIVQKIDKTFERDRGMVWGFTIKDNLLVLTYQKIPGTSLGKKFKPKGGFEIFQK